MKNSSKGLSIHAEKRSQQRGIRHWVVEFILNHADKVKHAGGNCLSQFVSEKKLKQLINEKILTPSEAEKVKGVVVIHFDDMVKTVFHKRMRMRS